LFFKVWALNIVFILMIQVLWFFGIHGSNVLEPVTQKLFMPLMSDEIFVVNSDIPQEIFNKTFFDIFIVPFLKIF